MAKENNPPIESPSGYEKRDVSIASVFLIGVIIVILIVVTLVILKEYFISEKEQLMYEAVLKPESTKLRELRAREFEELNSYKLLDPATGIYRIPIERAIMILAEKEYRIRMESK